MRSPHLKYLFTILLSGPIAAAANPLDEAARLIEEANMERLHAQQTRPGVSIDAFRSDGCSGGLSESWKTLARIWPEMAQAVGELPPWEACCVEHDRAYWRGEAVEGFEKRLRADLGLRQCVEQSGQEQAAEIAARIGIATEEVIEIFDLTAELMYHAVRIGGGPCTGLAWRWGHGWPPCALEFEPASENLDLVGLRQPTPRAGGDPDSPAGAGAAYLFQ